MTQATPAHAAPDDDAAEAPEPNYSTSAASQLAEPDPETEGKTANVRIKLVSALQGHRFVVPDADGQNSVTLDTESGAVVPRDALDYFINTANAEGLSLSVTDEPDDEPSADDDESEASK